MYMQIKEENMAGTASNDPHKFMSLTRDLCTYKTSVVADEVEDLYSRLNQELPFELYRFRSGETYNGWIVPPNWRVKAAEISKDGRVLFDGTEDKLGVGMNSRSFVGTLDYEALKEHVVTNPNLPDAHMYHCIWQIRNWDPGWALCVPHRNFKDWSNGDYHVNLVTEEEPGEMLVGEYTKQGRSNEIITFNTNTCHPGHANDGFAAVAMLIRLFQWLNTQDTYYSYRLLLCPEIIGSTFYLRDKPLEEIRRMVACVFAEMPGTPDALAIASTFLGNQTLDLAFRNAAHHNSRAYKCVEWRRGAGNDEVVWEAPGHEIPTVEITRAQSPDAPYPEYHSSLDDPDLMDPAMIDEFYAVLKHTILAIEGNATMQRKFDGLICLSNPEYDLYFERPDPSINKNLDEEDEKWGRLLHRLFRYLDGNHSILEIAERHDLSFEALHRYLTRFEEKELLQFEFSPLQRPEIESRSAS